MLCQRDGVIVLIQIQMQTTDNKHTTSSGLTPPAVRSSACEMPLHRSCLLVDLSKCQMHADYCSISLKKITPNILELKVSSQNQTSDHSSGISQNYAIWLKNVLDDGLCSQCMMMNCFYSSTKLK